MLVQCLQHVVLPFQNIHRPMLQSYEMSHWQQEKVALSLLWMIFGIHFWTQCSVTRIKMILAQGSQSTTDRNNPKYSWIFSLMSKTKRIMKHKILLGHILTSFPGINRLFSKQCYLLILTWMLSIDIHIQKSRLHFCWYSSCCWRDTSGFW
jgi:hypothetical protein